MDLFGDVDANGTPGDTSSTAHTSGRTKLINPGGELMGQPVSITGSCGGPDTPSVNIGKVLGKARIPLAPAFGVRSSEVRDVFGRGAKTGGADHGAVAAGKATRGHLFPAGVIGILVEEILDTRRVELASHLRRGLRHDLFGDLNILC